MRNVTRSIIAILVAAGLLGAMGPVFAGTSDENDFFSRINAERASRGLKALSLSSDLSNVARNHSQEMASNNRLYHNDNLGNEVSGWEELGENVGEGANVEDLHVAFMNSSVHRAEILGNYEKIGLGTVWKDGILWVTQVFFRAQRQAQQTTSTTTTTTSSRPRPATTTTVPRSAPTAVRAPIRAAGAIPSGARTPVPTVPLGVVIPLSHGRIQKLLGDLMIVPPDEVVAVDQGEQASDLSLGARGLGALLWRTAAADARLPGSLAA